MEGQGKCSREADIITEISRISRISRDEEALSWFRQACEMDRIYKFRGNLDPEISALKRKYGLDKEEQL